MTSVTRHAALRLPGPRLLSRVIANLRGSLAPRPVVGGRSEQQPLLLLLSPRFGSVAELPAAQREFVAALRLGEATHERRARPSVKEALAVALPRGTPAALTRPLRNPHRTGDIAIVSLPEALREHGAAVGAALLSACEPPVRTVLDRGTWGSTSGAYRTMDASLLAGDPDLRTQVREHGVEYSVDLAETFWSSRRSTERRRIVERLRPGQVLCDVMSGVGPFAIPAAKRGLRVLANDLNPASFKYLEQNVGLNKVDGKVQCFNLCGREFVRCVARAGRWGGSDSDSGADSSDGSADSSDVPFDVAVMNLPGSALEFLDAFVGVGRLRGRERRWPEERLPLIHCYCFAREDKAEESILRRMEAAMGHAPPRQDVDLHRVRDVSPGKAMFCVSFVLPAAVAYAAPPTATVTLGQGESGWARSSDS